ncbi:MAG TPA: Cys-tRNA(Pro) deacylase [Pseudomonas sp.]|jgi:Cys-tRNA(Pro)/Cys-tRNA(Cys) deacylase|uniref:Cys-tRNA(Pro)/Cys-tRNA(Cys) deacylase n=1 Tax=Halopseudomonas pachastrellae TaxID=254161 RepID=A0A1S8DI17_9GAMM|nr:Cys-tRNA(Pro) deacylase [Halopseudomonas pachastrellae]MAP29964.1 Cys-tRNA(Pro) deacylase [Pseudomonas sp.]MBB49487.1 Cys-tRNA(Pro) deacylase [Pseudomonadales bacterium]MAQ50459.1 Cys-tRNA(Pro) deacylase [Pseudomonas sp.]MBF78733.1 Cys-tRNA(Pro) deacylase [Pseudomonadales bacterium]ONM44037.1 aminoacyl-tRNA deacylase [Halopseudomonas pachastrellae]|tara:strand:+ start:108 stop:578 length:471 start_codon:yes stop_codon:yes gene_type:complete
MTPATKLLDKAKVAYQLHRYTHDPQAESYGGEAADKLGLEHRRVFKTLLAASETGELLVAVVPVSDKLNLKALAAAAKVKKTAMADPAAAQRSTGYLVGGISPLGQKKRLRTFIDSSAADWDSIFVSGGRRGLEIELKASDLQAQTNAQLSELCRD